MKKPTTGSKTITLPNGFHRKIQLFSFGILLTEIGGCQVKAVRVDNQPSRVAAMKIALENNPGWRFKALADLTDRDFDEGEK